MTRTTKTTPETWLEFLPPGASAPDDDTLLTRAQLLQAISDFAGETDLRYWEYHGILPRPVRKWRDGATRALYPWWILFAIRELRTLQANGLSLAEIRPKIRSTMGLFANADHFGLDTDAWFDAWYEFRKQEDEKNAMPPALVRMLRAMGQARAELTGTPTDHIEVLIVGKDGRKAVHTIDMAEIDAQTGANESG